MVDPELFAKYREAMRAVARLAHDETVVLVADIDPYGDPSVNALRLLVRYPEIVAKYGTVAVTAAREYYERSRALAVEAGEVDDDGYEAVDAPTVRREWAEEDVRKATDRGIDTLAGEAVRRVMQRGDQTLAMNAMRDPAHPMWAIIPHPGACGWCLMVASNGWSYSSERAANAQRHSNCKCTVAVDFNRDHPSLKGYNPDAYYDVYDGAIKALGGNDGIFDLWDALSPEERAGYKRPGRSAYDVFKTKVVTAKMDEMTGHRH